MMNKYDSMSMNDQHHHKPDLGMQDYAEKSNLFSVMSSLLQGLLLEQPGKPIEWMIDALRKPPVPSVVVLGPPGSGFSAVSSLISQRLNAQYISVPYIVQQAIAKGTTLGLQAKPYVDKGRPVPDLIILALLNTSMADPDTKERGYVLEGFPQNRQQALTLARRGILPNHLVVFDVPDQLLLSATGAPPTLTHNLAEYRRNLPNVMALFPSVSRQWTFEEGLGRVVEEAAQAALTFLSSTPVSKAPRGMRVILASLPGNVTEDVGELCAERYGCVLVSPRTVILEQISASTSIANSIKKFVRAPHEAPTDAMAPLIARRLQQPDCIEHGWILADYPTNMVELGALKKQGVAPSRLIWLDTPAMTCLQRMTSATGDSTAARTRLAAAVRLQSELGEIYGVKRKSSDGGIFQLVDAADVTDNSGTQDPAVSRIFERVVDALQRDVPTTTT